MSTFTADADFAVWVGCLACYNEGRLVGEWVDASECVEYVPCTREGHNEWWVFDHEAGSLIPGECSPQHAADVADALQNMGDTVPLPVIAAYCDNFHEDVLTVDIDLVEEAYEGEWQTWRAYADDAADEYVLAGREDDTLARYFDYEAWARDLAHDYWTAPASNHYVHVFRSL